jgi:hypothetical protein
MNGMWLGVDLRTKAKKMCVHEGLDYTCSKYANHSRLINEHGWGDYMTT